MTKKKLFECRICKKEIDNYCYNYCIECCSNNDKYEDDENVFCELCLKNQIKKKEVENKKIRKYNKAIQKAIKN